MIPSIIRNAFFSMIAALLLSSSAAAGSTAFVVANDNYPPGNEAQGAARLGIGTLQGTYCVGKSALKLAGDYDVIRLKGPKAYFENLVGEKSISHYEKEIANNLKEFIECKLIGKAAEYGKVHFRSSMTAIDTGADLAVAADGVVGMVDDPKFYLEMALLSGRWVQLKMAEKMHAGESKSGPITTITNVAANTAVKTVTNLVQNITNNNQSSSTSYNPSSPAASSNPVVPAPAHQATPAPVQPAATNPVQVAQNSPTGATGLSNTPASPSSQSPQTTTPVSSTSSPVAGSFLQHVKNGSTGIANRIKHTRCESDQPKASDVSDAVFVGEACGTKFYAKVVEGTESGFFYGMTDSNHADVRSVCPADYRIPTQDELKQLSKTTLASILNAEHRYWTATSSFMGKQQIAFRSIGQDIEFKKVPLDGSWSGRALCVTTA
jgi:hypothetical protein